MAAEFAFADWEQFLKGVDETQAATSDVEAAQGLVNQGAFASAELCLRLEEAIEIARALQPGTMRLSSYTWPRSRRRGAGARDLRRQLYHILAH